MKNYVSWNVVANSNNNKKFDSDQFLRVKADIKPEGK